MHSLHPYHRSGLLLLFAGWCLLSQPLTAVAQGRFEDYQRAEKFLFGNVSNVVHLAEVSPHWIEKTNRFWYRRVEKKESQFILVDAEANSVAPAFDHARLAAALSMASKKDYKPSELPLLEFDFVDSGKAIRFVIDKTQWTCRLADYGCQQTGPDPDSTYETLSPSKRWAAYVKEHNLYLRDTVTGPVRLA